MREDYQPVHLHPSHALHRLILALCMDECDESLTDLGATVFDLGIAPGSLIMDKPDYDRFARTARAVDPAL